MGIYLNPGKTRFQMALNSEIFVDKTEMIQYINTVLNTSQRYISVSRPRRFGKTMAADMLCAYYDREADSHSLFENRKIAQCKPVTIGEKKICWDTYLGKFDVIRIVMTDFIKSGRTISETLALMTERILDELNEKYQNVKYDTSDLFFSMNKFYRKSKTPFIIVIDEWDAIFREYKDDKDGQKIYLDFLRDWLKDKEYIALAYITGILPIKKYGKHSALNMFTEYSMTSPKNLAKYAGFTKEEVLNICELWHLNYEALEKWYDGYRLTDKPSKELVKNYEHGNYYEIYSPLSVVNAAKYKQIENYWNKTETYEALAEYIRMNYDGLKDTVALLMDGGRVRVDLSTYQNDMTTFNSKNDILALLIHLGYLGYIKCDNNEEAESIDVGEVFIPNREILDEFKTSTKSDEWDATFIAFKKSQELLKATLDCDEEKVAQFLEDAHNNVANKTYNDEAALNYAVQFAYYAAQKYYMIIPEFDSGKGFIDVLFIPNSRYANTYPVLLVELKYERTADTALTQIKQQKYPARLEQYKGNILLVGVNYKKGGKNTSPEFKHHTCKIEKA